ncbi:MAG TPA: molybdopterin-dependent oxidoreductase [Nevskiaceae bacterium]|nr:molybdopterin-dependent oxidoreductase [Nevskiaceae bacterium]
MSEPQRIKTYCRICEPQCGLVATVADGRITKIEGNRDHVLSAGHLCVKANAAADVIEDPDRLLTPMKRVGGPGEFVPVSWEEALGDIVSRLKAIRARHGNASFATFFGNPPAFSYACMLWLGGFQQALDVKWKFGVNSNDGASRMAANHFLFGTVAVLLKPDLWRTQFLLVLGANPYVSHGSSFSEPKFREAMKDIVARGGRVVVVDPRRSETARQFEHVAIRPGTDAWLLMGMIRTLFDEDLVDREYVARYVNGADALRQQAAAFDVETCAQRCGIDAVVIRQLARDFAGAESAVLYGRTGTCQQRFGTLNNLLQDAVNALTGNVERPGGARFGWGAVDFESFARKGGFDTYGKAPTRAFGHPDVFGMHPSTSLGPDILAEGPEKIRALVSIGANPVLSSAGGGAALEAALEQLDLHFSLDLYVNETNRYAHYVLPVTNFYERDDVPMFVSGMMLRPSIWPGPAVVKPRGEAREEWEILQEIASRMGVGGAYALPALRWLAKLGVEVKPRHLADLLLRTGSAGDWFGLKPGGLNLRKIEQAPDGIRLRDDLPVRDVSKAMATPDKRIHICSPPVVAELARLRAHEDDPAFPLRMIGLREIRSENSWLHNVERVMPDKRTHAAHIHPQDAAPLGIVDGEVVQIASKSGVVRIPARLTTDVARGTIAIPHGWGHRGGWKLANARAGVSSNELASGEAADIDALAGMSILTGIPIRLERAAA